MIIWSFVEKPVHVQAVRLKDEPASWHEVVCWIVDNGGKANVDSPGIVIHTLEGSMHARPGDWIIRGIRGFYPCKPDIFEQFYCTSSSSS